MGIAKKREEKRKRPCPTSLVFWSCSDFARLFGRVVSSDKLCKCISPQAQFFLSIYHSFIFLCPEVSLLSWLGVFPLRFSDDGMVSVLFHSRLDAPLVGNTDVILFAKQSMGHSGRPLKLSFYLLNTKYHPKFDMIDIYFIHLHKNIYWATTRHQGGCQVIS